jgi:hypothetical protein
LKRRSVVQQTGVDVGPSRPLKTNSAYAATCLELPSLSWLDGDEVAVLYGLKAVARTAVADMLASGERPPEAFDDKKYSGTHLTHELHRRLAPEAADQWVSLSQHPKQKLAMAQRFQP